MLPHIKDKRTALAAGLAAFGVGWYCLYEAYDRRGARTPWWLRWATWW